MLEATLRGNAETPELLEMGRFKDFQIQPHVANKPASTVATVNKYSDSAQCPPLSIETTPSAAPGCGSDESSRGSPVANRTRSQVNEIEVIMPSHFQSETAVASNDHACVGNGSQSVGYTSSKTQLVLQIPNSVTGVTKHFEDFVKCDSMKVADAVKEAMKLQWSSLIMPGKEVKVKLTGL